VPIAETLGALDDLVRDGKVGAFGASNVDGTQLRDALAASTATRYEWVQNSYSLLDRGAEREVLPLCAEASLGFTPFSPLAGGWLTGKYVRGAEAPAGSRMTMRPEPYAHFVESDAVWRGLDGLAAAAAERGTSQAALALAWLLGDSRVTAVVVGPRRAEHLEPALTALEQPATTAERDELARLFPA
jgi:Predicted oxidoreductases (related to aryl-alcohol dehydrogenases)